MASIDVVIPCYNYARFLPECVGSVLSQDVGCLRVIIIDNASTDNSVSMAKQLAAMDPRVQVICHENNLGPRASFNDAFGQLFRTWPGGGSKKACKSSSSVLTSARCPCFFR